jgi:hypothetical protein
MNRSAQFSSLIAGLMAENCARDEAVHFWNEPPGRVRNANA